MLATEHWRTDAVGDIVHQSASVMPRPECQRGAGRGVDPGWQEMEEGRWYSIITKRFMRVLGDQMLAFRKGKISWERKWR